MSKRLSEMTLEELWQLFPIVLTPHRACWADWYAEEARRLAAILPAQDVRRIAHIGSTAVETIWAKPIIDILVEAEGDFSALRRMLTENGYLCMSEGESRLSFNRGYTENGFAQRVFHLHLRRPGDHDELYFRDMLIGHPDVARAYERLKLDLWKRYEHDRDAYTHGKADFVAAYTRQAKAIYGARYE